MSQQKNKIKSVLKILAREYPSPKTAIEYTNPFTLLVATILSAQCTDKRVNEITKELFKKYNTPEHYIKLSHPELEKLIFSTGFYKNKAKNIKAMAEAVKNQFGGKVPETMAELVTLPGVGRKTANVLLSNVFDKNEGICVDTHMIRLSNKLGFSKSKNAIIVEKDLMKTTDRKDWGLITNLLIPHGRTVCFARNPQCQKCCLSKLCPSSKA